MKTDEDYIKEAYAKMVEEEREIRETNQKILSELPDDFRSELDDLLSDVNVDVEMSFVESPEGEYQTEDSEVIKGSWVDQWRNGGYCGDDYAGNMFVKIEEDKYLKIPYWC